MCYTIGKRMNRKHYLFLLLLRLGMGWLFVYAGISKIVNPNWTAAGFLQSSKMLSNIYGWFALPGNIIFVDFLNEWGLTLIGVALIVGAAVKYASYFGILLMLLYYFPTLEFPYAGGHSFIVDEHVIYILVFLLFIGTRSGEMWGVDRYLKDHHILVKNREKEVLEKEEKGGVLET
ncbi:MAG TPA: DoxX family membrane protein [Candidatus Jorgensenbacteria bacterium]|nr:DoxX family membrane protein [Candidatus Jorgensenbacteria bacterium]